MEDINYTPNSNKNQLIANHTYTHVPYPIICNNGNDPVTYIDLLDFGTLKRFGITDYETGLNPNADITTWQNFVISVDKHIRALNARIQSLESTVSLISITPSGNQEWYGETQDTFTANTNVNWMLSNTTDFSRTPASGQSTTIRYIGTENSSGTLEILTNKSSYTVGETAQITIRFNSGSSSTKSTTVTASSQISNTSKSFTITKYIEATSLSGVMCTNPDGSIVSKSLSNNAATFLYTFSTSGSQTFTASGTGVTSVSTTVTVSAGETPSRNTYWYVGIIPPTDPNNAEQNTGNNKWTPLSSKPSQISVATDMQIPISRWYVAIPHNYGFQPYESTGSSPDNVSFEKSSNALIINNIQYDIYHSWDPILSLNVIFKE